ncbi:carbohydrate ABC transporter permease [Enterovibrio norvegicus]|uniref:carbohydrate ABC transporter permease n=1 Tax=Enterovibrio norvegicus TaxID=188144 RepID=UPI00352C0999
MRYQTKEKIVGLLFVLPYMALFNLLLLYPFAKGFWISLHDWNLLEVAFNPDSKTFIGFDNYYKLFFPRSWDYEWDQLIVLRGMLLAILIGVSAYWYRQRTLTLTRIAWLVVGCLFVLVAMGWGPEGRGRMGDRRFWTSVANTLQFVAMTVPTITILALLLAIRLNQPTRTAAALRTLFFGTQVLSVTVVTLIWQMMYSPSQGFITNVLKDLGLNAPAWLTDQHLAMPAIVITTVWWSLGFALVVFLSGLQGIPSDRLEAANLDNAKGLRLLWYIVLPSIKRTTSFVVVMQIILHFQVFGQSHLMTNGGPGDSTQVLVRYIYQSAFRDSEVGYASAMAMVLFLLMLVFSAIQMKLNKSEDAR